MLPHVVSVGDYLFDKNASFLSTVLFPILITNLVIFGNCTVFLFGNFAFNFTRELCAMCPYGRVGCSVVQYALARALIHGHAIIL